MTPTDDASATDAPTVGAPTLTDDERPTPPTDGSAAADARASRTRARRTWELVSVALLTVALAGWRLGLALQAGGPTVFTDETLYFRNARSIATLSLYYDGHYPPFYSALLAPAFWVGADDPWRVTLLLSAVVGAAIVPAAYVLARSAGARLPVAAAAFVAVLMGTSAYSQQLMSEAVGVPLVLLGAALALRGRRTPPLLMGVVTVLLCLTKYLYLPLAAVLLVTWWWMRSRGAADGDAATRPAGRPARALVLVALPFVVAMPLWLTYATASGSSIARATGADIVDRTAKSGDVASLAGPVTLWLGLYVGYLVVACVPPVLVLSWLTLSRGAGSRLVGALRSRLMSRRAAFLLLATVLTAGYLVLATRHSLGARYNQPDPHHYMGRYLTHLVPLLAVAAVVGLDMVLERRAAMRTWRPWAGGVVTAAVVYAGYAMLFGPVFDRYDELWGATFRTLSPDVYELGTTKVLYTLLALVAVSTVLVALRLRLPTVLVWIAVAALGTVGSLGTFLEARGSNAHKIADAAHSQDATSGRVVVCVGPGFKVPNVGAVAFWDLKKADVVAPPPDAAPADSAALFELCRTAADAGDDDTVLYVTTEPIEGDPVRVDDRWGTTMYVYRD